MNQNQFQKALQKFEQGKLRRARAEAAAEAKPVVKADPALPFIPLQEPKPEKVKTAYVAPKMLPMTITFDGPVCMKLTVEYSGTLMGGQLSEQALRPLVKKALSVLGRVI